MVKSSRAKRALYSSGALDAWHRRRNRDRLTVIGFHRVLPRSDPRFATSDPEYTLPLDVFADCLGFFKRHYHVVSLDDVLHARRRARRLPERPLLITFDDGWRDNVEYALPLLRAARVPAAMFVAGAALDREAPFWQEQVIAAWRFRRPTDSLEPARALIAALETLAPETRDELLATARDLLVPQPRSMVSEGPGLIGRCGFTAASITDESGAFRPDLLALQLFRTPTASSCSGS